MLSRSLAVASALVFALLPPVVRAEAPSQEGFPKLGASPTVTMISTGAAPRTALRYKLQAGSKSQMLMTMAMGTTISMGGTPMMSMDLPTMKMAADIAITNVAANGDATYEVAFTDMTAEAAPGTDPAMAEMMKGALGEVKGLKGTATVSSRGIVSNGKFAMAGTDPALAQAMSQLSSSLEGMSMPLPEEAVGVGAKWEVRQSINSGGATVYQKTDVELMSVEAGVATFKVAVQQTAPKQPVSNPALPAGVTVTIDSWTGTGTGNTKMRMDSLVPTSDLALTANAVMSMDMGGNPQQMGTDIRMKLTITPGTVK